MKLEESEITFYSYAPIEDITAVNIKTAGIWEPSSGKLVLAIPVREFQFDKSLMQEHFNEKYMESDKYPRAYFKGVLQGFDPDQKEQELTASGTITVHGVEKPYVLKGTVIRKGKSYLMDTAFKIKLEDHEIEIPSLMWQNIAEVIEVNVKLNFTPDE